MIAKVETKVQECASDSEDQMEPESKIFYAVTTAATVLMGFLSVISVGLLVYIYVILSR
ncbi:MAG: hypothetical protein HY606_14730 [Planctomycetes bacterium]|nr:hypothetical protein [Planctomycetota bacterium]